jgi:hypothetical protein
MAFRLQSLQYLTWFVPSLILIAALYSPLLNGKGAFVVIAALSVAFVVKLANPDSDFGISVLAGDTATTASALSHYCGEHRTADLYVLGVDDEFYSAVLPLHRVHYGWLDPKDTVAKEHPYLQQMGILIPAAELSQISQRLPTYRDRLRAWGVDSTQAVATGLPVHNVSEFLQILHEHPESDFLLPRTILPDPEKEPFHRVVFSNAEALLMESKSPVGSEPASWTCEM